MDFYNIKERIGKKEVVEIYPDFKIGRSKDLMVRGKSFYAVWDDDLGMWSTDEYDVQRLIDKELVEYAENRKGKIEGPIKILFTRDFSSNSWVNFRKYMMNLSDNAHQLDEHLTFSNTIVKKTDYVSRRLPYPLEKGSIEAFNEIMETLYGEEREKIEWAIGAIISGEAKSIQKFIVLYGEAGTGKSTILNIIQKLFEGYYTTFEAKALTSSSNAFSTEVFKSNPLVAIQHDGDLSRIEDNTKLNSIVSHEEMTMNEKYKPSYTSRINSFLFMGTNKPVKITDAKSGIIRRLIDVKPTGKKIPTKKYHALMQQIDFELGGIAQYCLDKYREMGKNYYSTYKPLDMIFQTDVFFNFVETNYYLFKEQDGVSLKQAYDLYKTYCEEALVDFKLPRHKFREELKNYFRKFDDIARIEGKQIRSYYSGFIVDRFKNVPIEKDETPNALVLDQTESLFDDLASLYPAQLATENGTPMVKWANNKKMLKDINTNELHYVKVPHNHIVIDFDLKDEKGNKSLEKNLEAASKWLPTYAEFSKSERGIHLHYYYDGDVEKLSRIYEDGIEIKVFTGNSSLRRKLSRCNNVPIATINSGIPLKGDTVIDFKTVKTEKGIRDLIIRNLNKEFHPGTKPSVDFIYKILDDAYSQGLRYDVTDLRPRVLAFANNSTNQAQYCIRLVNKMQFKSEEIEDVVSKVSDGEIAFYDVEVYPNLFLIVWKHKGKNKKKVRMFNPTPQEVEELFDLKLVGFNNRRYDNHMLYARYIGYNNEQLFELSQRIISNSRNGLFGEAYNISYTDVYDYATTKQSLKKWEIELGIKHKEMDIPWDEPVDESLWEKVAEYCEIDVDATEAVFEHTQADFTARLILSELSGLTPNDTTQQHTARIIFGKDPKPQEKFIYTDLSKDFPGYKYEFGKSTYRGEDPSEGGYVYAEPGMYTGVALLDVKSMHPSSAIVMNIFGPYTKNFEELKEARVAIKEMRLDDAKKMLNGILTPFLKDEDKLKDLAHALKIIINIVYGLTSAKFENKFKDPRNKDNIVAKRGALFMIDLKHAVQEQGYTVAHIKTDSIKIPNADDKIINFVKNFGKKYGYDFDHETTFDKMCLVNNAVYIAKEEDGDWTATGAQFAHPYIFKKLFSKEEITFDDLKENKAVTTSLYLDMNENNENEHDYHFVGKVGSFIPIKPGKGGGVLLREKDGKYYAATGSKGYRWLEAEMVKSMKKEDDIDMSYYVGLVDQAIKDIDTFGDAEWFIS